MKASNAREIVLNALMRIERDGGYSNLVLDSMLRESALSGPDKRFASRLFYGTVERKITLERLVSLYSSVPPEKMTPEIRVILMMGFYQICYMDVPDSAAVNESVSLAGKVRSSAKGFVNAVLRRFIREGKDPSRLEEGADPVTALSIRCSCPEPLVRQFIGDYGMERTVSILEDSLLPPPVSVRVNPLKVTAAELTELLSREGVEAEPAEGLSNCLLIRKGVASETEAFRKGLFHVQDIASQICALSAAAFRPERVFDLCAAPGGKSFTIAEEIAGEGGEVVSFDLHPNRVRLIERGAARLGLSSSVKALSGDASVFDPKIGTADCVLCDVPCSGLGVIRRKPEIKYKDPESFAGLPEVQYRILRNASDYVGPGGILIYSTCSLSKRENEEVVSRFAETSPSFKEKALPGLPLLDGGGSSFTFFPEPDGPDGFYLAMFQKTE